MSSFSTGLTTRSIGVAAVMIVAIATAMFGLQKTPTGREAVQTGVFDQFAGSLLDGLPDDGLNRVIVRFDDPDVRVDGVTSAGTATADREERSARRRNRGAEQACESASANGITNGAGAAIGCDAGDEAADPTNVPGELPTEAPTEAPTEDDLTPGLPEDALPPVDAGDQRYLDDGELSDADQALIDAINGITDAVGDGLDGETDSEIDAGANAPAPPAPSEIPTPQPTTDEGGATDDEAGVIVRIDDPDDLALLPGVLEVRPVGPGYAAVTTELTDEEIQAIPGIADVEPDVPRELYADQYGQQWALRNTRTPGADIRWEEARQFQDGQGVVVAVIDSGVDTNHPDLASQMWFNPGENCANGVDDDGNGYIDDCNGWDFANNDNTVNDAGADNSHGTHVSGIIAGDDDGDGIVGASAGAEIMSLKIFHNGGANSSRLTAAINYAVDNGADVINMSLGGGSATNAEYSALRRAEQAGIAVIAAAGNSSRDNDRYPTYPAGYNFSNLVSVASSNSGDQHSSRFSNYGRTSVDLHAPGEEIYSALPGARTGNMSGTSMATPYVSAVAALVVAQGRQGADVRQHLMDTARPLPQLAGLTVTGARLDAAAAVGGGRARSSQPDFMFGSLHDGQEGTTDEVTVNVGASLEEMEADSIELRATLGAAYGGDVYAVMGHTFSADGREISTDDEGRFLLTSTAIGTGRDVELRDGIDIPLSWDLPPGDYALMVEAVRGGGGLGGTRIADPRVVFFRVAPEPGAAAEPVPGDGGDGGGGGGGGSNPPPGGGIVLGPGPDDGSGDGGSGDGGSTTSPPPSSGGDDGNTGGGGGGSTTSPPPSSGGGSGDGGGDGGGVVVSPPSSGGGGGNTGGGSTTSPPPSSGGDDGNTGGGSTTSPPPSSGGGGGGDGGVVVSPPSSGGGGDGGSGEDGGGDGEVTTTGYVSPSAGQPSQASVTVQIDSGIPDGAYIHFDGSNATILSRLGPTRVTVRPPAHTPGTVDVAVVSGGERTVLPDAYTYLPDDSGSGGGTTSPPPTSGGGGGGDSTPPDSGSDGGGGGSEPSPPGTGDGTTPTDPQEPFEHNGLMLGPFPDSTEMSRLDSSRVAAQRCTQDACGPREP